MYDKLKNWLILLYQNAKKEFSERPIATLGVLVVLVGGLLPLLLSESLRSFVVYLLLKLFLPKVEASLLPLIIAVIVLAVAFIPLKNKIKDKNYNFVNFDGFDWKVSLTVAGPYVDPSPYCANHQVKMLYTSNDLYVCPVCGSKNAKKLSNDRRQLLHESVENIVEAQTDGHINI